MANEPASADTETHTRKHVVPIPVPIIREPTAPTPKEPEPQAEESAPPKPQEPKPEPKPKPEEAAEPAPAVQETPIAAESGKSLSIGARVRQLLTSVKSWLPRRRKKDAPEKPAEEVEEARPRRGRGAPDEAESACDVQSHGLAYRIVDIALAIINRPFAGLSPRVRHIIGVAGAATIVISALAPWLLPMFIQRRDAVTYLQEKRAELMVRSTDQQTKEPSP